MFQLNQILNLQDYIQDGKNPFINKRVIGYMLSNMAHNDFIEIMSDYFIDLNDHIEMIDNKVVVKRFFKENKEDIIEWLTRRSINDFTSSKITAVQSFISQKTKHNFNVDDIAKILHTDDTTSDSYVYIIQTITKMIFSEVSQVFKDANKGFEYDGIDENLIAFLSLLPCGRFVTTNTSLMKSYLNHVGALEFHDILSAEFDILDPKARTVEFKSCAPFYRGNRVALIEWLNTYVSKNGTYSSLTTVLELTRKAYPDLVIDLDDVSIVLYADNNNSNYYDQVRQSLCNLFSIQAQLSYQSFLAKRASLS